MLKLLVVHLELLYLAVLLGVHEQVAQLVDLCRLVQKLAMLQQLTLEMRAFHDQADPLAVLLELLYLLVQIQAAQRLLVLILLAEQEPLLCLGDLLVAL